MVNAMKPKLRIFSNLARTGGTLVSRCLGSMERIALLSEIHPFGSQVSDTFNILTQARNWYQVPSAEQLGNKRYSFNDITRLIAEALEARGLQLVIRDWVHVDFMAVPFLETPYYRSRLVEFLEQDFDIIQFHLVRHPVPQWFSTNKLAIVHGRLSLEQYLEGHYRYAELCRENGYVRYEDFTAEPERNMQIICANLQVDYDPGFMQKWSTYVNITGDDLKRTPQTHIRPARLPAVDAELYDRLHRCEYYQRTIDLLGYADVPVK
jgi:hypothetical protein